MHGVITALVAVVLPAIQIGLSQISGENVKAELYPRSTYLVG